MSDNKKKVYAVHLYNDYSGSPRVLADALSLLCSEGYDCHILTSQHKGFLESNIVKKWQVPYFRHANRWLVLFFFMLSQCICFFLLSALLLNDRFRGRVAVVLVNTMLPSAACLAAKFFAKECIVYVHETSVSPAAFKKFLRYFVNHCASNVIYVSHYLQEVESFEKPSQIVIYNGLRADLSFPSDFNLQDKFHNRYVLFCGSLKDYKGIGQLVELAKKMCDYQFMAALNCEPEEIEQLANSLDNLTFLSRPDNLGRLYEDAFLVVNLSLPDQWVETFGLSLLEGMAAGCPVIGPPVGGPMELVTEEVGKNIDSRDVDQLEEYIRYLGENYILWEIKSRAAAERAELFGADVYQQNISVFFSVLFSKQKVVML